MLKILCVIESGTWADFHIAGSLRELGHEVRVFHTGPGVGEYFGRSRRAERREKNLALLEAARSLRRGSGLDLIFCYVYDDFLEEATAEALANLDAPMVNYNVDMVNQWYRQTRTARYFSMMLCAQKTNMEELARYNPRVLYFPMAARSGDSGSGDRVFLPAAPVTFLGMPMQYRARVLSRLHAQGIPLALYGKVWKRGDLSGQPASLEKIVHDMRYYTLAKLRSEGVSGLLDAVGRRLFPRHASNAPELPDCLYKGYVPAETLSSFFRGSAINLGFTRIIGDDPDKPGRTQLKLRDFEVPLAGGFYLVERTEAYEDFFKPGIEVETWATPAELLEKIQYYLSHEAERQAIARAGRARAVAENTWGKRFATLFAVLGLEECR